jgi:hypothetical protein
VKAIAEEKDGKVKRLALAVGALAVLCMIAGACWASEEAEPQGESTRVKGAVWLLPPAYEFSASGGGHLSLEVGATPALWPEGVHSRELLGPRVGVFIYPGGELEGLALYAGLGEFAELGLWGVWRPGSSDGRGGLSLRAGIGVVVGGPVDGTLVGAPGIGAAVGFSF